MTAAVLNTKISAVKNIILNTCNLVTPTVLNTKINEVEDKIPDNSKYITTTTFNKLTTENFAARLKQADLLNETDFDNNKQITSNKIKYLKVQKELNSLITKYYNFFLGRIYFTSNDGSLNRFAYQVTLDTLEF